jgi:drug/metabolite transporter (DMT)-like permease
MAPRHILPLDRQEKTMTNAIISETRSRSFALGAAASLSVVLIWAAWLVSTRHSVGGAGSTLTALDLSLLRYGIPAIVLAPVWLRTGLWPKNTPKLPLVLMVLGSGALFFQIVAFGMRHTPASAAGVLLPGAMPFFTALIGIVVLGERPDFFRKIGLAAILGGGLMLLAGSLSGHPLSWISYVILPVGATCWAIYTHAFRHTGLTAFEGGALICVWSTIFNLIALPFVGTGLFHATAGELGLQVLTQGILSGLLATILYGVGVRILGGTQAAAYTAITPVAAAFAGAWILGEPVGPLIIAAAFVTGAGVLLSTGILSRRKA